MSTLSWIVIASLVVGYMYRDSIWRWFTTLGAKNWPMTTASVEQTCSDEHVIPGQNRVSFEYEGGILYSYQVNGEFYSGQHNFGEIFSSTEDALASVEHWVGKKILIHYRPDKPEVSAFLEEHSHSHHA